MVHALSRSRLSTVLMETTERVGVEVEPGRRAPCVVIEAAVGLGFSGSGVGALHPLFRGGRLGSDLERHDPVTIRAILPGAALHHHTTIAAWLGWTGSLGRLGMPDIPGLGPDVDTLHRGRRSGQQGFDLIGPSTLGREGQAGLSPNHRRHHDLCWSRERIHRRRISGGCEPQVSGPKIATILPFGSLIVKPIEVMTTFIHRSRTS